MCNAIQLNESEQILAEVAALADERTIDLFPMLMEKLWSRDSLTGCIRHDTCLYPYVASQINLTRAKRNYERDDWYGGGWPHRSLMHDRTNHAHRIYISALTTRDEARRQYHSVPCTCWVTKRQLKRKTND